MNALVSVIVPVYNVAPYLRECLDSIECQTHPHLEIILVNDGSTDDSAAICEEYSRNDHRIRVIHQENQGVSVARNTGIRAATGTYLQFVDSDDWMEPTMTETLVRAMETNDVQLVVCSFVNWSFDDGVFSSRSPRPFVPSLKRAEHYMVFPDLNRESVGGEMQETAGIFLKLFQRKIIVSEDILFERKLSNGEDLLFSLTYISKIRHVATLAETLYNHRLTTEGLCGSPAFAQERIRNLDTLHRRITQVHDAWILSDDGMRISARRNLDKYVANEGIGSIMRLLFRNRSTSLYAVVELFRRLLEQPIFHRALTVYRPPTGFCRTVPFFLRCRAAFLAACAAKFYVWRKTFSKR